MTESEPLAENEAREILATTVEEGVIHSESKEVVIIGGVVRKKIERSYYFASCGHVVRRGTDLGGRCGEGNCGSIACKSCTRTCSRCLKILCPKHSKIYEAAPYCSWCRWLVMFGFSMAQQQYEIREETS